MNQPKFHQPERNSEDDYSIKFNLPERFEYSLSLAAEKLNFSLEDTFVLFCQLKLNQFVGELKFMSESLIDEPEIDD